MSDTIPAEFKGVKLTKDGSPDTRSKKGRAYADYLAGQTAAAPSTEPEHSGVPPCSASEAQAEVDGGLPSVAPVPRLGSHQSAEALVRHIAGLYPEAKPSDWRTVQTVLQNAMRYGKLWGDITRKG